jgi:hypothetical protein
MRLRIHTLALFVLVSALPVRSQEPPGSQILARSAACNFTIPDYQDILAMDNAVLQTPLSVVEMAQGRQRMLAQFRKNPDAFCKALPAMRHGADIMRHGSEADRRQLGVDLWTRWLLAAPFDPIAAQWVAVVRQHNPPFISDGGLAVSKRQLDALFASNDWVAQSANLPTSTAETRTAFQKEMIAKFASLPQLQKERLAKADERWAAVHDIILIDNQARDKTIEVVRKQVHTQADVPTAARVLEDMSVQVEAYSRENAQRTSAIIGALGQAWQAQNLGTFNAHAPH